MRNMNTTAVLWINTFLITLQKIKSEKSVPVAQNNINITIYHQLLRSDSACVAQPHKEKVQTFAENDRACYCEPTNAEMRELLRFVIPFFQEWYDFFSEIITDRLEESAASSCPEDWGSRSLLNAGL